jgi:hypothetical protein
MIATPTGSTREIAEAVVARTAARPAKDRPEAGRGRRHAQPLGVRQGPVA